MSKKSAGILLFRDLSGVLEVLLAHPGGPFWEKKDIGAWSIPKGEFENDEDPLAAARREFKEETGFEVDGVMTPLKPVRQPSGKLVFAWALERDLDLAGFKSNSFSMDWPPGSGKEREFPEIDRISWFSMEEARRKILKGQLSFLAQLLKILGSSGKT